MAETTGLGDRGLPPISRVVGRLAAPRSETASVRVSRTAAGADPPGAEVAFEAVVPALDHAAMVGRVDSSTFYSNSDGTCGSRLSSSAIQDSSRAELLLATSASDSISM